MDRRARLLPLDRLGPLVDDVDGVGDLALRRVDDVQRAVRPEDDPLAVGTAGEGAEGVARREVDELQRPVTGVGDAHLLRALELGVEIGLVVPQHIGRLLAAGLIADPAVGVRRVHLGDLVALDEEQPVLAPEDEGATLRRRLTVGSGAVVGGGDGLPLRVADDDAGGLTIARLRRDHRSVLPLDGNPVVRALLRPFVGLGQGGRTVPHRVRVEGAHHAVTVAVEDGPTVVDDDMAGAAGLVGEVRQGGLGRVVVVVVAMGKGVAPEVEQAEGVALGDEEVPLVADGVEPGETLEGELAEEGELDRVEDDDAVLVGDRQAGRAAALLGGLATRRADRRRDLLGARDGSNLLRRRGARASVVTAPGEGEGQECGGCRNRTAKGVGRGARRVHSHD